MEKAKLDRLMRSILDHHVFIAKAVIFEDGAAFTEDGHQALIVEIKKSVVRPGKRGMTARSENSYGRTMKIPS